MTINRRGVLILGASAVAAVSPLSASDPVKRFWDILGKQPRIISVRWLLDSRNQRDVYLRMSSASSWDETERKLKVAGLPDGYEIATMDFGRMLEVAVHKPDQVRLLRLLPVAER